MARRGAGARFMGGAWVFPGGVVDESDGSDTARAALDACHGEDVAWRAAALRELVEEAGVWFGPTTYSLRPDERPHGLDVYRRAVEAGHPLGAAAMAWFSNWVTPTSVPVRFDARFYVAVTDAGVDGVADGREMDAVAWIDPGEALERAATGGFALPLPTRKTMEHFAVLGSPEAIVAHARSLDDVPPIQPRIRVVGDGRVEAVLPGDPGFAALPDAPPDPDALARAARVTTIDGESIPELRRREG